MSQPSSAALKLALAAKGHQCQWLQHPSPVNRNDNVQPARGRGDRAHLAVGRAQLLDVEHNKGRELAVAADRHKGAPPEGFVVDLRVLAGVRVDKEQRSTDWPTAARVVCVCVEGGMNECVCGGEDVIPSEAAGERKAHPWFRIRAQSATKTPPRPTPHSWCRREGV